MAGQKTKEVVAGYMFDTVGGAETERNQTVCQIIARAGTDNEQLGEPRFNVEFGDGYQLMVFASELTPWFPTD